ncbi:MAG: alpha-amylase family glycosyl hydrolase [Verrucomicrobiota bacterium]|jgi:glycosidase
MSRHARAGKRRLVTSVLALLLLLAARLAPGDAMLELFQQTWPQVTQKMPEIAEAGYDSLWLPNPAKGNSGGYSIGYDAFDPFDLGSTNQQGTVATYYGTEAQLLQMVQTAHRFGIRVYFDNVMNHRSSVVPGYPGSGTPTNYYPGLVPQDFHLQVVSGGYENWSDVSDWCTTENVENNPLLGLCDLANEPGTVNWNFGPNYGDTTNKPVFVRFPGRPDLYMDTNGPLLGVGWGGAGWRPFDGHGQPVPEDVSTYLCRAVAWTLYTTKCDGFRLDAAKHVPVDFFGNETGQTDDPNFAGYTGAIQAMYDYVHGYGRNVTGNGYVETDGDRNCVFNTEAPRNDAMVFGEYIPSALPQGEDFYDYLNSGMRLLNQPLYDQMNSILGGSSMSGLDQRDYTPPGANCDANGNYSTAQGVNMPQTQDSGTCCPANESLEDAYFFLHEGLPGVYSDGFNHNTGGGTPIVSDANYLGEGSGTNSDNTMPDTMYLHNQLSRGGTWSRWSDQNVALFERYDYREGNSAQPQTQAVVLFGMNDNAGYPGDISFDDGVTRSSDDYYLNPSNTTSTAVSNSRGVGLVVGFAPGSVLAQLASSSPTGGRAYQKLLVHGATSNWYDATNSANASDPTQRLIYIGSQTLASGGGAIELTLPSDAWVMYGYQWPEASRANVSTNAIIFRQAGSEVPHLLVYRTDGPNGQAAYNPLFPYKMRGSVDPYTGDPIQEPGEGNISNLTYAISVPVVTNANFDIVVRSDASCSNTLVKLDGGIDLNSQMGLGPTNDSAGLAPTNFPDFRDNKPGYASDVFLGYEQTALQFRNGPEKFAARIVASNNLVSPGAETYSYSVDGASNVLAGAGFGADITNQTASWVYHDPAAANTALAPNNTLTQRVPLSPAAGQPADIYVKVGYQFQINTGCIYYTTDGSDPAGAFGVGQGTTQVVPAIWVNHDSAQSNIDWWKGTLPAQPSGTQVSYQVAFFSGGSADAGHSIQPISDAEPQGSKYYGVTQAAVTNFNPATATVWLHNDLNPANTTVGLQSGFHIVRARVFLPRPGQASVYNTFLQTFYYDGALPTGAIAYPPNGGTINSSAYTAVVRADSTVTGVDFNIQESDPTNDDTITGQLNGIGNDTNGNPIFVAAAAVTPDPTLSAIYTNYPQEFRFVYPDVPGTGTATIFVRLNEYATSVHTNRFTLLSAAVNTLAPVQVVEIASPATNGAILPYQTNSTFLISACFSPSLATSSSNFNVLIDGVLQPQANYILRPSGICAGMKALYYNWNNPPVGTNVIEVVYTNAVPTIGDTREVIVAPPLAISRLGGSDNRLVLWDSTPGLNYEVLATTNLTQPFQNISGVLPSQGATTSFYDSNPPAPQKFYQVETVP